MKAGQAVNIGAMAMFLIAPLGSFAYQDQEAPPAEHHGKQLRAMMPSPDDRLEHLSQALSLTDDQKAKIRPMLEDESSKMQALWQDTSTPREDKRAKMQQIHEDTTEKMNTVLNEDQQKKLAEMQAQMKQHMNGRR